MTRDGMVQTALRIKRQAVLAAPWRIEGEDTERVRFIRANLQNMQGSAETVLEAAMAAFADGWSLQEKVLTYRDSRWWLERMEPKDPARFGLEVDRYGEIERLKLYLPGEQERELDPERFVVYSHATAFGDPRGTSDLVAAYPHWRAKRSLHKAWQLHLEKFAMPTVLGKYERGLPEDERRSILAALRDLQDNSAIVYPSEIDVQSLTVPSTASQGFQEAIEFHNREIARAVLGQTLTTDEGRRVGSLALGKVHLQVLLLQVEALRKLLADRVMTEQVIRPLVELNFGPGEVPRFVFEPADMAAFRTGQLG
jgi:phage gp29-like protein